MNNSLFYNLIKIITKKIVKWDRRVPLIFYVDSNIVCFLMNIFIGASL